MTAHWQDLVKQLWGIDATLAPLVGEYDLNFFATSATNPRFVLKIMHAGCAEDLIDMQTRALTHLRTTCPDLPLPAILPLPDGTLYATCSDADGHARIIWAMQVLDGETYARFTPKSDALIGDIGAALGTLDAGLREFTHPGLMREFKWDLTGADWIAPHTDILPDPDRRTLIDTIARDFAQIKPALSALPDQAIHNDANDYNLLVGATPTTGPRLSGLIDFGDMCAAPRVCDLAIAGAYMVLDHPRPDAALAALVAGYHRTNPLAAAEIDLVWPLLLMRLAVSLINSAQVAQSSPDDPYVVISQAPAWRFLEGRGIAPGLINARLRAACGLPVTDAAPRVRAWLDAQRGSFANVMGTPLDHVAMGSLAVENCASPQNPFDLPLREAARVGEAYENEEGIWLGYYNEPRLIYADAAFRNGPWKASDRRTVHLAVDAFAPAAAPVSTPLNATVQAVENRDNHLDYGGVVILRHETSGDASYGDTFYTLYGHLDPEVCDRLYPGQTLDQGEVFARLGSISQNGGWPPHLHFQLALSIDGIGQDWPGVASPDEMYLWGSLCPNPAALLNLNDIKVAFQPLDSNRLIKDRLVDFGANLKLSYNAPVTLVRGWRHHLFDQWGRPYLDAYNNVPHVGHAHPRIQSLAAAQLARINTNTRYLHPAQGAFANRIIAKMPASLTVCYFVNSGSEANELALRLARAASGGKAMITPDHGYHGNTTGAMDVSAYKFNAPGGSGQPDWVELIEVADDYRGSFSRQDPDLALKFANLVDDALASITAKGGRLAGFIAETFPSVGGQIIPPKGYLPAVYAKIRAAGGVCIADEVQTGLGRLGAYYFGFEHQGAVPDIVVLGKPIGNGHPIGVVITTPEIAAAFARGPEFFSTFGGSTLSCKVGAEVLDIIDDELLQSNAETMGERLLTGLVALKSRHAVIGDVRGMGLFVGVDLVTNRAHKTPATDIASYVVNRMRERRILIGVEGPADNILKIRPPLTIEADDIDMILAALDDILGENAVVGALI